MVDKYHLVAQLIIYDEVHSLLSSEFIKVLLLPLYKVISGEMNELPLMVALSATYPSEATNEGKESIKRLNKLFGSVFRIKSEVVRIPVNVWDYRDHYTKVDKKTGEVLKGADALGNFDSKYNPLDDYEAIEYFSRKIIEEGAVRICKEFKGLVMTERIETSFYAALYLRKVFRCNVVLIRAADEPSFYFSANDGTDFEFDNTTDLSIKIFLENNLCRRISDYKEVVDNCEIIVGTYQRLKEGFSVQNVVWGICTKFVYSTIARIQILGRIRRNSNNEVLNNHPRLFYVVSGSIPTTIGIPNFRGKHHITYDIKGEAELFRLENYNRV